MGGRRERPPLHPSAPSLPRVRALLSLAGDQHWLRSTSGTTSWHQKRCPSFGTNQESGAQFPCRTATRLRRSHTSMPGSPRRPMGIGGRHRLASTAAGRPAGQRRSRPGGRCTRATPKRRLIRDPDNTPHRHVAAGPSTPALNYGAAGTISPPCPEALRTSAPGTAIRIVVLHRSLPVSEGWFATWRDVCAAAELISDGFKVSCRFSNRRFAATPRRAVFHQPGWLAEGGLPVSAARPNWSASALHRWFARLSGAATGG